MTRHPPSFQRNTLCTTLICLILLRSCYARNIFYDLDLATQTLNPAVTGFTIIGNPGDLFGYAVDAAGDINKDGYDDILVGAYFKNGRQGAVYVIYGGQKSSLSDLDLSTTSLNPSTTGFTITGDATYDWLGYTVSTAGDIDKDGFDDIIVSAPNRNIVYVIYGGTTATRSNIDLSSTTLLPGSTGFTITASSAFTSFGDSVSTAGDVDKDGYDDIIIGAYYSKTAFVIYGGSRGSRSNIALTSTTSLSPGSTGFTITDNSGDTRLGSGVGAADIDGDGYSDIIIGSYYKNNGQGAVYVIYGGSRGTRSNWDFSSGLTLSAGSTGFMITGSTAGEWFGHSVNRAGDVNKDNYDDIIIGAPVKNGYAGAAYVIYGGPRGTRTNLVLSSTPLNPSTTGFMISGKTNDNLGSAVGAAGDINGDGYDDIIVGAYYRNNGGTVFVIYGKAPMSNWDFSSGATLNPSTTGFTITPNAVGDWLGCSASTAGDINNDGYDDIVVSAPQKNGQKGAVYVIYASCQQNCKQCSSETVCTACKSPYLLYQGGCLASCPTATMATATTCEDCPTYCNKCSSTTVCTECQTSYLMYQSECFASCPNTTFANTTTTCEDCPTNCNKCSSTSVCTECTNSYLMYQSECFDPCPDTTFASTPTTCEDCPSNCNHCNSTSFCTECISPFVLYISVCLPSCPTAMFNSSNECIACPSYCSSCTSQDTCEVCYPGFILSNSLCAFPEPSFTYQEVQEKATQSISSATRGISSVICVGSTVAPFATLVSSTVQNTRYLNLSVTSELSDIYKTWRTDLISWEVPNVFSNEDHFEPSLYLFAQYDIDSPFLVNFWPTLLNIGIGSGTFIAFILLQKIFELAKYEGWAYSLVQKFVAGSFNFALVQAYACLNDILFYLVIDAKTNPVNSFFSWASLITAAIFLAFGCLLVFFNFWTVKKYQSIKNQGAKEIEAFNEKNKYWELFYSDFSDDNFWGQSFFAILVIRSTISSLIITVLFENPLMQTLILTTIDGAMILFLYFNNPFNTLRGTLAQYYYEIITLLVHLCAFALSLQNGSEESSDAIRVIFSFGIIYLNTALITGAIGFMFIEIYKTISEKRKEAKRQQAQNKLEDNLETQKLTQTSASLQASETGGRLRQGWANQDQTASSSIDNPYGVPGGTNQNCDVTTYDLNMESSRAPESNFNVDNSRELGTRPIRKRIPRTGNQKRIKNSSVFPINHEQSPTL